MKRIYTSLLVALVALFGIQASALASTDYTPTEVTVVKASGTGTGDNTNSNGDVNFYNAEATSWLCTQANISGGNLNNQNAAYGGSYAVIVKFNLSETLAGMNIQSAQLSFRSVCTVSGKNSNVIVSSIGTNWDATTVTWNSLDKAATQISEGTGQNVNTSAKTLTENVTSLLSEDEDKVVAFAIYTYTAREQKISDIKLTVDAIDASSATKVKLQYVDENNDEIKSEVVDATVGSTLALTDAQKASFFSGDKKYIYVSDNSAEVTIANDATSVITINYREAETWTYTLNAVDGENTFLMKLISSTAYELEKINIGYPAYINLNGALWSTGKSYSNDGKGFQTSVTMSEDNITKDLTYTKKDIENIVYFSEGENIEGMTVCNTGNATIRSSNAAAAFAPADVTLTSLPVGKYALYVICYDAQKTPNSTWTFKAGTATAATINCTTINYYEAPAANFTISKESDIILEKGGSNSIGIDLIYIVKTGDLTEEEAALLNAKADLQAAIAEAEPLAEDAEAVAVGKLIDALNAAKTLSSEATTEQISEAATTLTAAIEQFKQDNAESGINVTSKVGTAKDKWVGAGGTAGSVTTIDGTVTPLAELYSSAGVGTKMSQTITGLDNGLYRVKVFATSHNARGEDGAELNGTATDVAYVFATSGETTNKTWITASGVTPGFLDGEQTTPLTIEDIEVANGELTIGLTVDKEKQTGWHTIQIYSLEQITTAKAAWAAAKESLQKQIDAATDTLKIGENGKTELQTAIDAAIGAKESNKLNIAEVNDAEAILKAAIHEFFEANIQIREDIYYVQETTTGKFLSRGAAYGTRAVVDDYGVPVQLTYVADNKYTIKGIDNNSAYGFDESIFSDANGNNIRTFTFTETTDGYKLTNTNNNLFVAVNYTGEDSLGVIGNSETGSIFKLLSVADYKAIVAANKKAINEAAITNAGYKLDDPLAYTEKIDTLTFKTGSAWTFTAVRDDSKTAVNENGTEVFQGTGKFTQNIENLAAGLYKVTVQAMYRDGANTSVAALYDKGYNLSHAYLDANGSRVQVKSWGEDRKSDTNPNSMSEFAALANEGKYVSEGLAAVGEDGKLNLTVAVPSYNTYGWFIANQVTYQKVDVDSVVIYRAELQAAITKAEGANTVNKTQESINTLNNAIVAAKELVNKEEATAAELVASKKALEDAVAGLQFKALELTGNTIYGWNAGMEGGGKAVASDEQSVTYPTAGYTTIRLNGAKDFSTAVVTITLDNAVSAGDTIKVTAFRNKNAADKKSGFKAKFENGEKIVSTTTGLEFVNIDSSEASAADSNRGTEPNTCEFIVPEEAAGSKVITLTRAETGTNLFITELYIEQKQFEKKAFEGFVAISAAPVQNPSSPMAPTSTAEQTVKIAQTAEKGKVNITFSGFQLAPMPFTTGEFTLAAIATDNADGSISYTSEPQPVSIIMGQMAASYTATIEGTQASADATPKLTLQLKQASIFTVVFAATETEAKDGIEVATGIQNVKTAADNKTIYNLNGQKVNKAQKGLNIINGKKIVIK